MPTYESFCSKCGAYHEYVRTVSKRDDTPECCGQKTEKRVFSPPMGWVDFPAGGESGYQSPVTGMWIDSKQKRVEDLKRNGCRPWEGMEQEQKEADRRKAYEEQKADEKLTQAAEMAFAQLKPEQRRQLETAI